jgi:hypothetical protein
MDIEQTIGLFLPMAADWVQQQETHILENGVALTETQMADAIAAGVQNPSRVRLLKVNEIPSPTDPLLNAKGMEIGLVTSTTVGMSMRYGIFLRPEVWNHRMTLVHELTHTAQYERLGGIVVFLTQYLTECLTVGYHNSPMEQEAIRMSVEIA